MCYSYKASINAFIFNLIIIVIILNRNNYHDKWMSLFIGSYAFVQLGEGLIWKHYNTNKRLKELGLFIIMMCLILQPIIQSLGGYLFSEYKILYLVAILFGLSALLMIDVEESKRNLTIGETKHLSWSNYYKNKLYENIYFYYYGIFMIIPLLTLKDFPAKNPLIIYGLGSLIYSYYNYYKTREFTSFWCYTATIYSLVYYIFS
jgi:hypothetical protein